MSAVLPWWGIALLALGGCGSGSRHEHPEYREMADALHAVIWADRKAYTELIVERLALGADVVEVSEYWGDDEALLLPAQMLRAGAHLARERDDRIAYALLAAQPINPEAAPETALERQGLAAVLADPQQPFYGEEVLAGTTYFTAVYADLAASEACVSCHNQHPRSPKTDYAVGDVMGGLVVRIRK